MDRATYRALVADLEQVARQSPDALRRRVYAHIALGYAYVGFIVIALVTALVVVAWMAIAGGRALLVWKLIVALIVFLGVILRALWVKVDPPHGLPLDLERVPQLRERVETIRSALRSPHPHHVLLTEDFNASVTQVPRLGIFGWPSTYLVLGLPLMYGLSPAEFDAVLAHEFAHLSGAHPKRGLWVYRMGRTWNQLMTQLESTKNWGAVLFQRFIRWYGPRLDAYGFVMSRRDEYSADADAAGVTSAQAMGSALVALHARGKVFEDELWRDIWRQADRDPEPPAESWTALPRRLQENEALPSRNLWVGSALSAPPSEFDTHPTLRERLSALGVLAADATAPTPERALALVAPFEQSAAEHYLGTLAHERLRELEQTWQHQAREPWSARFKEAEAQRTTLEALEVRDRAGEELDVPTLFELTRLTASVHGDEAATPFAHRLLALNADHVFANFQVGRTLLSAGDETGVEYLERVLRIDPDATPVIVNILYGFHSGRGDLQAVHRLEQRIDDFNTTQREAQAERESVLKTDTLVPAELTPTDRELLARVLRRFDGFRTFWVVRKVTVHKPKVPFIVLLAERRRFTFTSTPDSETAQDMVGHVRLEGGPDILLFIDASQIAWMKKQMRRAGAVRVDVAAR